MKPWFKIAIPREFIRSGEITEVIFVPDLIDIVNGIAPLDYQDPELFFENTYLTKGLVNLLSSVRDKVMKGKGKTIVKLQTPFGGGKTHALIVIYHYIKHGDQITKHLPDEIKPTNAKLVTVNGTQLNPLEGKNYPNSQVYTIWGDIAYQLAGIEGYKEFEENDKNRISPGIEKINQFLSNQEPFVLLLDEIVEYLNKAFGIPIRDSNLGTQTLSFIQELTEALSSDARGILIITIPTHTYEDFSTTKISTLKRLNHILGRVEATEIPFERGEVYKLVTKRLFENIDSKDRDVVISEYIKLYYRENQHLPQRIQDSALISQMKESYPFHPDLINLLIEKWNTLPTFQGTRAILRIFARILSDLWSDKKNIDLICISDISLEEITIQNEFLSHINSQFKEILIGDIIGQESRTRRLDKKHPEWNNLALKIAKSIFMSSFATKDDLKGINLKNLRFSLANPNFQLSLIGEIANYIYKTLWYLHFKDGRYFFSFHPNLNRKIEDLKQIYSVDLVNINLQEEIRNRLGKDLKTILWPSSSKEIPDNKVLKIIIIKPPLDQNIIEEWLQSKGNTFRRYKNTVIFAVPVKTHLKELYDLIRTKLSLNEIISKITQEPGQIPALDQKEAIDRKNKIEDSLSFNIRKVYSVLHYGNQKITLGLPRFEYESLTQWYNRELRTREYLISKLHYRTISEISFSSKLISSTQDLLDLFYTNPNFLKIDSEEVIREAINLGVSKGEFGFGLLKDMTLKTSSFCFSSKFPSKKLTFSVNEVLLSKQLASVIRDILDKDPTITELLLSEEFLSTINDYENLEIISSDSREEKESYNSYSLEIQDFGSKHIIPFYRGVIRPLELENADISINIKLDIKCENDLSKALIENKIKETIAQLGAQLIKFDKKKMK